MGVGRRGQWLLGHVGVRFLGQRTDRGVRVVVAVFLAEVVRRRGVGLVGWGVGGWLQQDVFGPHSHECCRRGTER